MGSLRETVKVSASAAITSEKEPFVEKPECAAVIVEKPKVPFCQHSTVGFCVETEVRPSSIPGGGIARYLLEPVKRGQVIRSDPLLSVTSFIKNGGVDENQSVAIHLKCAEDIEELTNEWTGHVDDESEVRKMISWFMASVPPEREGNHTGKGFCYIFSHSFHANHRIPANHETTIENGNLVCRATCDMSAGDEFFLDYTQLQIQDFASEWCEKHGLKDVETFAITDLQETS